MSLSSLRQKLLYEQRHDHENDFDDDDDDHDDHGDGDGKLVCYHDHCCWWCHTAVVFLAIMVVSVKAVQSMRILVPWVWVRDMWVKFHIYHSRSWFPCETEIIKATNASVLAALIMMRIPTSCPSCPSPRVWLANRARGRSQKLHTCSDWRPMVCLVQRRSAICGIDGK